MINTYNIASMESIVEEVVRRDCGSIVLSYLKPLPFVEELLKRTDRLRRAIDLGQRARVVNCPLRSPRDWSICREQDGYWNVSFSTYTDMFTGREAKWSAYAEALFVNAGGEYTYRILDVSDRFDFPDDYDDLSAYISLFE